MAFKVTQGVQVLAERLMALFQGSEKAFVKFWPNTAPEANGKLKGVSSTVKEQVTIADFQRHLIAKPYLGIIPLQVDGRCWWAALDDDRRGLNLAAYQTQLEKLGLPLVAGYSKSGGVHVCAFFKYPVLATAARAAMERFAQVLKIEGPFEVFPKQTSLDDLEVGNALLLPVRLTDIWADLAEKKVIDPADLLTDRLPGRPGASPKGKKRPDSAGRNSYLLSLAGSLYLRGASQEAIEAAVRAENDKADVDSHPNFADGPLPEDEVALILRSARKLHDRGDGVPTWCEEINREYALVQQGGDVFVMREHLDPVSGEQLVDYCGPGSLSIIFANRKPVPVGKDENGQPKYAPLHKAWLSSPHRREYPSGVIFEPGRELNGIVYNLWRGWPVPDPGTDPHLRCQRFLWHTRNVICSGCDEWYNYILGWLAHMVQRPNELPEVAGVLRWSKGAGKGAWVQYLKELVKPHFSHLQDADRLTARFNSHVLGKLLVFADEAFFAGDRRHAGQLKGLITERTQLLERKFREPVTIRNYARLIVASNEAWVVPADKDARRFFVLDVNDDVVGNRQYFKEFAREKKGNGPAALLAYLQKYDLDDFEIRDVPLTDAASDQKSRGADNEESFIEDLLHSGKLPGREGNAGLVPMPLLVDEYLKRSQKMGIPRRSAENVLAHRLKGSAQRKGLLVPKTIHKMRYYIFPTGRYSDGTEQIEQRRGSVWELPPLSECRTAFEAVRRQGIDWSGDPDEWSSHDPTAVSDEAPF